jgi:hypothetical protein
LRPEQREAQSEDPGDTGGRHRDEQRADQGLQDIAPNTAAIGCWG